MNFDVKHFEHIIKAAEDNSLAIFVGAGVSKSAENDAVKFPTWSDLIEELKVDLGITYELDYLKVAQLYFLEFGSHTYYKKVKRYFPDNVVPSKIHDIIFGIKPHCVITTNWDCLLETSVLENAYIYDLVCNDQDLMKSGLDKKLIKMHGDFRNHNIVFKEDDYINYEFNFPLVSNYIKSILSTHTVIFLGYSYSDIDIKQIIKWAQNHTSVRPPMYLLVYENDIAQSRYLASHGVQTLLAGEYEGGIFHDCRSNKLHGFLKSIKDKKVSSSVDKSIINIVYAKLIDLGTLNSILVDQITNCLSECYIVYREIDGNPMALLKFYRNEVTQIQNTELREVYSKFKKIIKNSEVTGEYKNLLSPIFDILQKADIAGVICDDEDKEAVLTSDLASKPKNRNAVDVFRFDYNDKFDFSKKNRSVLNLSFDKTDPYLFFQQCNFEMAYHCVDTIIKHELKHKNYSSLLISLLNHNMILHILKNSLYYSQDNFKDAEVYDINERFDNFPKNTKRSLSTLLDVVTVDYMFKFIHSVDKILTKNKDREDKRSFLYIDAEEHKADFLHKNILYFIKENGCLVDNYSEFKYAINKIFEIKTTKQKSQSNNDYITFSLEELYSAIKYLDTKKLIDKFKYKKRGKYLKLQLDKESAEWLSKHAFKELSQFYKERNKFGNYHLDSFKNSIYLLAFSDEAQLEKTVIHKELISLLSGDYNQLEIIECITEYVTICFNNNPKQMDKDFVSGLMNVLIKNYTSSTPNQSNYYHYILRSAHNVFIVARELNLSFNDHDLLKQLLLLIDAYNISEKANSIETIIHELFIVGDDLTKEMIREFIKTVDVEQLGYEKKIGLRLFLLAANIIDKDQTIVSDALAMVNGLSKSKFSTELYSTRNILKFLVENKKMAEFSEVYEKMDKMVNFLENKFLK